ncbi:Glutathione-S-transferase [Pseudozyma hubeiensis]|nr:Glutathione-S-transferase [Pseudozyma hubeiensis]
MTETLEYTLFYWPEISGRGEFVRLCFEATGVEYSEVNDVPELQKLLLNKDVLGIAAPHFAVPVLGIHSGSTSDTSTKKAKTDASSDVKTSGQTHYISQTPAILSFLAPRLGLLGDADRLQGLERDVAASQIHQLCATALDLNNEVHDSHHPISVSAYYEDQRDEAKKRAADLRANRIPKFLQVFQVALQEDGAGLDHKKDGGRRLWGSKTSVADLTVFQVIDGLQFAFPKYMQKLKDGNKYSHVFALHQDIKDELKEYLESKRRLPYSNGVYRHYPELDEE